jgi:hypothetical protein
MWSYGLSVLAVSQGFHNLVTTCRAGVMWFGSQHPSAGINDLSPIIFSMITLLNILSGKVMHYF